jgi:hypothetical protein
LRFVSVREPRGRGVADDCYYRRKLEREELIQQRSVPHTILRAIQFHELVGSVLTTLGRAPDFGGPEVLTLRQVLELWPGRVGTLPVPTIGRVLRGFCAGLNTTPDHPNGVQTRRRRGRPNLHPRARRPQ